MLGEEAPFRKIVECYTTAVKALVVAAIKLPQIAVTAWREELRRDKRKP